MTTFSSEQLNFFKFSTVVLDEFPVALRQVFVYMWDNQVAPTPGFQKWDDSPLVRNMYLNKEGGKTKYVPTSQSFQEWDCTALFEATLYAQSFAKSDGKGGFATLDKLYVKPRRLPRGAFHHSILSPSGNQAETFALSLDQLRLLRNSLCHQTSTQKIDKVTFDHYIQLAKGAFAALGQTSKKIDDVGKLGEKDFPTARLQQLEEELRREKFKQIEDNLDQIETEVKYVGSDVKEIKWEVTDVKTKVEEVGSDLQSAVTDMKTRVEEVGSDVETAVTDVKTKVEEVGSEVKTAVTDVKTRVEEVGSDVKTAVTDVKTQVEEVGSDIQTAVTDVKTKVQEVGSDVQTAVTGVKTKVEDLRLDLTKVKASIDDIKQAMENEISKGAFVPDSCTPEKIPNFVGRQEECESIRNHLTAGITRLVNIWGPPGFGKTSVAINVAHHLRDMKLPVYFAPIRGMKSKEELVSKLLSMFPDGQQVSHISTSHWLIRCLQQVQNPFVLILDNADDLLESEDAKQHVLLFIEEIFAQCKHINLLLTTRESLDFVSHTRCVHFEKINVLDEVSSSSLVRLLLPDSSEDDRSYIVKVCGQVPLSMRLMCSIMKEENISINELSEELTNSTLVEVLDSESFPAHGRLKTIINTSFKKLTDPARRAFVSLCVFPGWFRIDEATAVLNTKTDVTTKKIIRSLERKSLIDCGDNFSHFTIHSLFRSFIEEKRRNDQAVEAVFCSAQFQFYDYYISSFKNANETFLVGPSNEASATFVHRRENILLSLSNGTRDDELYPKVVEVLSMAELFLCAVLPDEEVLFEQLYVTAITEAKRRQISVHEQNLLAAKSLRFWGWFSSDRQTRDHSHYASCQYEADCPAKLLCYHAIHQLLCGKFDEGKSSLLSSVDSLQSCSDEDVLKVLAYMVLEKCLKGKEDGMASHYRSLHDDWFKARTTLVSLPLQREDRSFEKDDFQRFAKKDLFIFLLMMKLTSWFEEKEHSTDTVFTDLLYNIAPEMCGERLLHCTDDNVEIIMLNELMNSSAVQGFEAWTIQSKRLRKRNDLASSSHILGKVQHQMEFLFGALESLMRAADSRSKFTALNCLKKAAEKTSNPRGDHEDTAESYYWLGEVQRNMGDLSGALEFVQKSSRLRKERLGDHLQTADSLFLQGLIHASMNDFTSAVDAFQKAAEINSNLRGDHKYTAFCYHNLGNAQCSLGNHKSGLESIQKAADMRHNLLGDHEDTAESYYWLGVVQRTMGDLSGALESFQKAADMRHNLLGDHEDTAESYYWLGVVQHKMGDLSGALESVQKSSRLKKKLFGDHLQTADSLFLQGLIHACMNDFTSAVDAFQKAAEINSNLRGDHKYTAFCYHNLGNVQCSLGNHKSGLESIQKAADIRNNLLGDHEDTAESYYWLGVVQHKIGDHSGALESFQKAADMRHNLLGDHEDTAESYYWLGVVQHKKGDLSGALESFQKAADMRHNLLGDHEDTAQSYYLLGVVQRKVGDLSGALESFQKAADMRHNLLGDHEDTAQSYYLLGVVQRKVGDLSGALESFQKAADMRHNLLGDHEDTAQSYYWLGVVQHKMGDLSGALESVQKSSRLKKKLFGDHLQTADSLFLQGLIHDCMNDHTSAVDAFQKAAEINSNLRGDHKYTAFCYHNLGNAQCSLGNHKSGLKSIQKAADIRHSLLGDHEDTACSYHCLGEVQRNMGDHKRASESFQKAADMRHNLLGDHEDTACSYNCLGEVQRNMGDHKRASKSFKKALDMRHNLLGNHENTTAAATALVKHSAI